MSSSTDYAGYGGTFGIYTFTFGPVFTVRKISHLSPFAEFLVGGYHQTDNQPNIYLGPLTATSFAMLAGGGLDVNLSKHIAVRPAEFDWMLLKVPIGAGNAGSTPAGNYRYLGGIVLRF